MGSNEEHIVYLDLLRIFASFFVIVLHVSAVNWYTTDVASLEWNIFNFWDSISRWTVPVFIMISGALFLGNPRGENIKKLYSKNIFKLLLLYFFWTLIYALENRFRGSNQSMEMFILSLIQGRSHLWFLLVLLSLYIIAPLLNQLMKNPKCVKYYLLLALIIIFILPTFQIIIAQCSGFIPDNKIIKALSAVGAKLNSIKFHLFIDYSAYFVLGNYLYNCTISRRKEIWIYIFSILGFVSTVCLSAFFSQRTCVPNDELYGNFTINVLLESIGIFTFFKCRVSRIPIKNNNLVTSLSKLSLGCYLVHILIMNLLQHSFGLTSISFNAIISVPIISFLVFLISYTITAGIRKLPIVGKYIA